MHYYIVMDPACRGIAVLLLRIGIASLAPPLPEPIGPPQV
jgi:hypothetical protein